MSTAANGGARPAAMRFRDWLPPSFPPSPVHIPMSSACRSPKPGPCCRAWATAHELPPMRRLFVAAEQAPLRAALVDDNDRLQGAWQFAEGRDSMVGDRFLGRVLKIDSGLETAFVDIGLVQPGFLPLAACPTRPVEGQAVTVEVSRDPVAGKGARLTARIGEAVALPAGTRPPQRLTREGPLRRLLG